MRHFGDDSDDPDAGIISRKMARDRRETESTPMVASTTAPSPEHSKLPPSGASRWTVCTASIGFIERNADKLPKDDSTEYSREGTKAHDLAKDVLTGKNRLVQSDDPDMLINVRAYVDFIREQQKPHDKVLIERRTPLFYLPTQHGTVDCALISPTRIAIIDLKYGAGVGVYAEENKQLAIYTESLIQELELMDEISDDLRIDLYIFQPRDRNDPEPVRHWPLLRKDLRKFCAEIEDKAKAILADSSKGEFVPGEKQCQFCPAKGICAAYGTQGLEVISDEPVDVILAKPEVVLPDPNLLTRTQRLKVISLRSGLEKWMEAVEDQEVHDLMNGAPVITHKLVEGKTNRVWKDEEGAKKFLGLHFPVDDIAPRTILSPAQMEKYVKKSAKPEADFKVYISKPAGKASLVPVEDKRPALQFNADDLENLEDCI